MVGVSEQAVVPSPYIDLPYRYGSGHTHHQWPRVFGASCPDDWRSLLTKAPRHETSARIRKPRSRHPFCEVLRFMAGRLYYIYSMNPRQKTSYLLRDHVLFSRPFHRLLHPGRRHSVYGAPCASHDVRFRYGRTVLKSTVELLAQSSTSFLDICVHVGQAACRRAGRPKLEPRLVPIHVRLLSLGPKTTQDSSGMGARVVYLEKKRQG